MILKTFLDLKYILKQYYVNYKESPTTLQFVCIYILSIFIVSIYFIYIFTIIILIFIYVLTAGLYKIYWVNKPFSTQSLYIYSLRFKSPFIMIMKYYLLMIPIHYCYMFVYFIYSLILNNLWLEGLKLLISRLANFVFMFIFGFPVFYLDIINKIYIRLSNSVHKTKFDFDALKTNLNSMYFFDVSNTIAFERRTINYQDKKHFLN